MVLYIGSHFRELLRDLIGIHTDEPLSEAVPAIHGTLVSGKNQRCLCVLVLHSLYDRVVRFSAGIGLAIRQELMMIGKAHFSDGVKRIIGIDQIQIIRRYTDRIFF